MALLTVELQDKLTDLLVEEGLVTQADIDTARAESASANEPLMATMVRLEMVSDELLTHATAQVSGVPYVNLSKISPNGSWRCHWQKCRIVWRWP